MSRTFVCSTIMAGFLAPAALAQDVAVLTPYLSSVTTNEMIEVFTDTADARGWSTNVVDTRGDFGQLASRVEDVVNAGVDAIVFASVDPSQIQDQVDAAASAGIPVIAIDGAVAPGVTVNVTSDNFELGTQLSTFLFDQLGGEGNIVKFYHSAHPGVRQRELALDAALEANPGISVIADHYVNVPGPIDDSRIAMETILRQHGDDIDGVWAARDEPAIGALIAVQADMPDSTMLIAGIDGNPQAVELIGECTNLVGSVRQDFTAMSTMAADALQAVLEGGSPDAQELYAPSILVTRDSVGADCG
ncbi:MAG: sugar ABC transporter substrate-binding protein [Pseudomonadota bacterium]